MSYTQFTRNERYQIAILAKTGHDRSSIARLMNRPKETLIDSIFPCMRMVF